MTGAVKSWRSNVACTCAATSSGLTGWLNRSTTIGAASNRAPGRYQLVSRSFAVGVVNVKLYGEASLRPLTAVADGAIAILYLVARGSGFAGVKIRMVVPDQRNVPATAGLMLKNGGFRFSGTRPSTTIGSGETTRTSFARPAGATSPVGPALTKRSGGGESGLALGRGERRDERGRSRTVE